MKLALEERMNPKDVVYLVKILQKACKKADISVPACYGLLKSNVSEIPDLVLCALHWKDKSNEELTRFVEGFDVGMRNFTQNKVNAGGVLVINQSRDKIASEKSTILSSSDTSV